MTIARMKYITEMAKLTVWIYQRSDRFWEAVDWQGNVLATNKSRNDIDATLRGMACDPMKGIWAIAYITPPEDRRPFKSKPVRRSL